MAKSAKKAIAFGIVLVALGVIMSAVGGVVKAVQAAELDNYYNNYYGYGNASSQNTKSTTPASSTTTTIYVGNSTSVPSNSTKNYKINVSTYTQYEFVSNYSVYLTIKSSSGSTIVSRTWTSDKTFNSNGNSSLTITVENQNTYSNSFTVYYY